MSSGNSIRNVVPSGAGFLDDDIAVVVFDNAVRGAEPQAGSLAKFLGRKKRIKYPGSILFRNAASGIRYLPGMLFFDRHCDRFSGSGFRCDSWRQWRS